MTIREKLPRETFKRRGEEGREEKKGCAGGCGDIPVKEKSLC